MEQRLTEREGTSLLAEEFRRAGLDVVEGCPVLVDGVEVSLDGLDPARRIGFEFVTEEAGDRKAIGPGVVDALERMMARGELFVLLVDEWDVDGAGDLALAARRFLDELRRRGVLA